MVCELEFGISPLPALPTVGDTSAVQPLYYNIDGDNSELEALGFTGIQLIEDFISCEEEEQLIRDLDALPWDRSQSGRRYSGHFFCCQKPSEMEDATTLLRLSLPD